MTTSSSFETSRPMSRSEYFSTFPRWRPLLAMFNWRPVYDIEQLRQENARLAVLNSRMDALLLTE